MKTIAGKRLSDMLPVNNELKQGDALSPLLLNFSLECAVRRVQVNQDDLKLMVHISFWFMLMILIYWVEAYRCKEKHRIFSSC